MGITPIIGGTMADSLSKTNGNVSYFIPNAFHTANGSQSFRTLVAPVDGFICELTADVDVAPGVDNSWTFNMLVGTPGSASATAMEVAIAGTALTGSYNATRIPILQGQVAVMRITTVVGGAAPPTSYGSWGFTFECAGSGVVLFGGTSTTSLSAVATTEELVMLPAFNAVGTIVNEANAQIYFPCAGNITAMSAYIITACGIGKSRDFIPRLDGVNQGDITVNIAGAADKTGNDTGTVAVTAGQLLDVYTINNGGAAASQCSVGVLFEPTVNGNFIFYGCHRGINLSNSSTLYNSLNYNQAAWYAQNRVRGPAPVNFSILHVYAALEAPPNGAGKSYTFDLMVGAAAPGPQVAFTNTEYTLKDVAATTAVVAGNLLSTRSVPAGTPDAVPARISYLGYIAPTTNTGNMFLMF